MQSRRLECISMDYLKLSSGLGTTYERCTICNWYELDPYNVAPHHRMVEDGVCHVCLTACRGAQFVPSAALPDPFEGVLGAALGVDDLTPPPGMGLGALRLAQDGRLPVTLGTCTEELETPATEQPRESPNQDAPTVPGT